MDCASCGYTRNRPDDVACGMCRAPLARAPEPAPAPAPAPAPPPVEFGVRRPPRPEAGLGRLIERFGPNAFYNALGVIVGVALLVGAGACWLRFETLEARVTGLLFLGALGGLSLGSSLVLATHAVALYEHGLVDRREGKETVLRWDEVAAVEREIVQHRVNGIPAGTVHTCFVVCRDGRRLDYTGEELTATLQEVVHRRALPGAIAAFDRGEQVAFGELVVSPTHGLRLGTRRSIPWGDMEGLRIEQGSLRLPGGDRVPLGGIPNLPTLLALVEHGLRRARS